jgi:hypothetical protein
VVTATGTVPAICGGGTVQDTASATCVVACSPDMQITKVCSTSGSTADSPVVNFNGTVTNSGNVTLTGVMVVDDKAGAVLGPVSLAPGASVAYSGSYLATGSPTTNTVSASANVSTFCGGGTLQRTAIAVCSIECSPSIEVTKVCSSENATPQNPVILFNGTVTNTGDATLTGVVVVDDHAGQVLGPITLAPGASAAYSGSYTATSVSSTNVVTATGTVPSFCGGSTVQDTATASCDIECLPSISVTKVCQDAERAGMAITFNGTVTNTGNVTLTGVTVTDDKAGQVLGPITLAPGATATYSGSYIPTELVSTDTVTATGTSSALCGSQSVSATASATCQVPCTPILTVTKLCNNATGQGGAIAFSGAVINDGDVMLSDVLVVDVIGSTTNLLLGPLDLAAGTATNYSGSYVPAESPSTDIVIARGFTPQICGGNEIVSSASATCMVVCTPAIAVTKQCVNATAPGQPIFFSGTVSNTGNATLEGVTVVDDKAGLVLGPVTLVSGASIGYSGSYVPTTCPSTDTVTASGTASTICGGAVVSASAQATCSTPVGPAIAVTKNCVGNGNPDSPVINFNGVVHNTGNVVLNNVTVVDDKAGLVLSLPSLAVGATAPYSGSYVPTTNPSTDTVTATGTVAGDASCGGGSNVTASANCTASIACQPKIAVTKTCATNDTGGITFSGTVTNTGNVTLLNVVVEDLADGVTVVVAGPITLIPGQSAPYTGQYEPVGYPSTDQVTATGATSPFCGSQTVRAMVTCTVEGPPPPAGCRVTGGGRQFESNPQVRYVTHGGQVGASVGVATPFTPDSDCIKGQWQHVRHIKGGQRGNFHARSFDSLMCACLGCPENPDSPGVVGQLCNPGDRICGPEPRRAPANKICFSGVGDYTTSKGKKNIRSVVFRVDIEDRSEPGGFKPGGQTPPPDRYRIRIWFLDGNEGDPASPAGMALRQGVACADPLTEQVTARIPDIDDGGDLERGNHQLHPSTGASCR